MMNTDNGIYVNEATTFLTDYYKIEHAKLEDTEELAVALIGEGAWSRCFGYRHAGQDLAIRFGNHVDDFESDRRACQYATPDLPVPTVLDIGKAYDGYYAISTRVHGVPLESVDAAQWEQIIPSLVSVLEALRTADLSATSGFGGWGWDLEAANGSDDCWSAHLLGVDRDVPEMRSHGWREKLAASPIGNETFKWGYDLLKELVSDSAPRCLIHADLINRNVLVNEAEIAGVFDWGCSRYGDHLYELAWFEFWGSWYPELDMGLLRSALEQRWRDVGYSPVDKDARLTACHLHIGLDHLAYNSYTGDEVNLLAAAERMREMVS